MRPSRERRCRLVSLSTTTSRTDSVSITICLFCPAICTKKFWPQARRCDDCQDQIAPTRMSVAASKTYLEVLPFHEDRRTLLDRPLRQVVPLASEPSSKNNNERRHPTWALLVRHCENHGCSMATQRSLIDTACKCLAYHKPWLEWSSTEPIPPSPMVCGPMG